KRERPARHPVAGERLRRGATLSGLVPKFGWRRQFGKTCCSGGRRGVLWGSRCRFVFAAGGPNRPDPSPLVHPGARLERHGLPGEDMLACVIWNGVSWPSAPCGQGEQGWAE